jgi:hypothetical protein
MRASRVAVRIGRNWLLDVRTQDERVTHFALKTDCIRVFVENRRELSNQAIEGRSDAEPNTAPRYTASDSP